MNRLEFIRQNMKGKVLDVGCSAGRLHSLIDKNDGNLFGIDLCEPQYEIKENFKYGDAENMDYGDNSFDTIIAGELIEHLKNPERFLSGARRILKDDGILIITTPNKNSWVNRIFKTYNNPIHNTRKDSDHQNLFSMDSIIEMVSKYFKICDIRLVPYDEISDWGARLKCFLWMRKMIHHIIPQSLQEDIIILCRGRSR